MESNESVASLVSTSQMGLKSNDATSYSKLESMARNHLKVPLKKIDRETGFVNINRIDPTELQIES